MFEVSARGKHLHRRHYRARRDRPRLRRQLPTLHEWRGMPQSRRLLIPRMREFRVHHRANRAWRAARLPATSYAHLSPGGLSQPVGTAASDSGVYLAASPVTSRAELPLCSYYVIRPLKTFGYQAIRVRTAAQATRIESCMPYGHSALLDS